MSPVALLDTCVLYPSYLRDTLLSVAEAGLYRPLWSGEIVEELRRNLVQRGIAPELVGRVIAAMDTHFEDARVVGHEALTPLMTCDPKDRHVLAAAVHGRAQQLVTFNVRDFPAKSVAAFDVEVVTPDDFLLDYLDLAPGLMARVLQAQADRHKREPKTLAGLLNALAKAGVPQFAEEIRRLTR